MARSMSFVGPGAAPAGHVVFEPVLERLLCVVIAISVIKLPLGIPLYLNALLLAVGLYSLIVVQALQPIFLWAIGLVAIGLVAAIDQGVISFSGPRLGQLLLLVLASSLVARLNPTLLVRYLSILLPLMLLAVLVEALLPEPLWDARSLFGIEVPRHGGLQGEPNYNAMLLGTVAVLLAQHPPRFLAVLPLMVALPTLSRGLLFGLVAWLGAKILGRHLLARFGPWMVLAFCAQPLIVLWLDRQIDDATRDALIALSTNRYAVWVGYAEMGLSRPFGVGYFMGTEALQQFADYLKGGFKEHQAHSIFLQVFGEFGWAGYTVFVAFLCQVAIVVARRVPQDMRVLLFVLAGFAFLNGLSGWEFWVPIGYLLARAREAEQAPAIL